MTREEGTVATYSCPYCQRSSIDNTTLWELVDETVRPAAPKRKRKMTFAAVCEALGEDIELIP